MVVDSIISLTESVLAAIIGSWAVKVCYDSVLQSLSGELCTWIGSGSHLGQKHSATTRVNFYTCCLLGPMDTGHKTQILYIAVVAL